MGYTHYFPHKTVEQEVWDKILADCKKLRDKLPEEEVELGGCSGSGMPSFNRESIQFNGWGDESCECFHLLRGADNSFAFCKTRREPYDLMVCACLLVYLYHSQPTISVSSDGDKDDWQDAIAFITEVFGVDYIVKIELDGGLWNDD